MTLSEFCRIINRRLEPEQNGRVWRCSFPGVMFADAPGRNDAVRTIAGAGPTQERMREDFAQKIRGKVARVYDGMGAYSEYPVPLDLTA